MFVNLILEDIRIDGPRPHADARAQVSKIGNVNQPIRQVPENVQRHRRTDSCQSVNLRGVTELLLNGGGGRRLQKLPESRPGIRKAPRRELDLEAVQGSCDDFRVFRVCCGIHLVE